jgi:hypothetical protein
VKTVMNIHIPQKTEKLLTDLATVCFLRSSVPHELVKLADFRSRPYIIAGDTPAVNQTGTDV